MTVLLPLLDEIDAIDASPAISGVLPVASGPPRVLVVEDEPQVRTIAARALTSAGFEVLQAENGAVALTLLTERAERVDVIVTDVVMPELSGPELARAVKRVDSGIGLIFMSGFPEGMQSATPGEFADAVFLTKPFSPQTLVDAVRERMARRGAEVQDHG